MFFFLIQVYQLKILVALRKLFLLQRSGLLPKLPKGVVFPAVVAGLEGIGRGQDRESLIMFLTTVSQALGPERLMKFVHPDEAIKRLAAAQGIDTLKLIKTAQEQQAETQTQQQTAMNQAMVNQLGQLSKAPMVDPSKNPEALAALKNATTNQQQQQSAPQP